MTTPSWSRDYMARQIVKLLRNNGERAFRPKEIAKRLDLESRADYVMCRDLLEELAETRKIARGKGSRFKFRPEPPRAEGIIRVHKDGFGFVSSLDGAEDYFVPARRMANAMHGDRVSIGLDAPSRGDRKREAEVLDVLERARSTIVGTLRLRGRMGSVVPDDKRLTRDVYVAVEDTGGAQDGDKVVVTIDRFEDGRSAPEGRVIRNMGRATDPGVQVLAIALSVGIDATFPDEVLAEAERVAGVLSASDLEGREDFRSETVFTIDPVDAKDFDDALHIKELAPGRFEVGIHIADVSHYVREGTALDQSAFERATSTYLVDRVIPMLPERLSSDICSLRPDVERLTYSCVFELDAEAQIVDYRIVPSVIHSAARLSYEEAQTILTGEAEHAAVAGPIRMLAPLARKLSQKRFAGGAINFDKPEIRVILDDSGNPIDIVRKERVEAHKLIEEFMLLANRTVAAHGQRVLDERAFVFRVHDHPDKERIRQLVEYVRAFGFEVESVGGVIAPAELNRLLRTARGRPEEPVIVEAALRSMAKARYSPDDGGHFGLAMRHYTHFTSPIRRYPDLMVHRLLRSMEAGGAAPDFADLKARCDHCSDQERASDEAQRESVKLKQVTFMQQHVGDRFTGVVSGVTRFGVFVELDKVLVEGLIHVRELSDDYYEYDEPAFALVGRSNGRSFRLGDPLTVIVAAASEENRTIDFVLA